MFVCTRTCQNHRPSLAFCHAFLLRGVGPLYMRKWLGTTVTHFWRLTRLGRRPSRNLAFTTSSAGTSKSICSREIDIPERRCSHPSFYEQRRSKIRHRKSCTVGSSGVRSIARSISYPTIILLAHRTKFTSFISV